MQNETVCGKNCSVTVCERDVIFANEGAPMAKTRLTNKELMGVKLIGIRFLTFKFGSSGKIDGKNVIRAEVTIHCPTMTWSFGCVNITGFDIKFGYPESELQMRPIHRIIIQAGGKLVENNQAVIYAKGLLRDDNGDDHWMANVDVQIMWFE